MDNLLRAAIDNIMERPVAIRDQILEDLLLQMKRSKVIDLCENPKYHPPEQE